MFSSEHMSPLCVIETVDRDMLELPADEEYCGFGFRLDKSKYPQMPNSYCTNTYKEINNHGYQLGHQGCAGNYKLDWQERKNTYVFVNVCATVSNCNSGSAYFSEVIGRQLVEKYGNATIYSGPIFGKDWQGNEVQVIKIESVTVPSAFWKIFDISDNQDQRIIVCLAFDNTVILYYYIN
jgi:DNA/RNA endonuclease G (NUC1)